MTRKYSNFTVIEVQTNKFDENEIRNQFKNLEVTDEVALVFLVNEKSDEERKFVRGYHEDGVYDITRLGDDDSLIITDLAEYLTNSTGSIDEDKFQHSKFVIKCNICNHSFLNLAQLNEHNLSDDHYENFVTLKSLKQEDATKTSDALTNCIRELMRKHRNQIKCVDINNKIPRAGEVQSKDKALEEARVEARAEMVGGE